MKTIEVEITGKSPLLMNNPRGMIKEKGRKAGQVPTPEEDAEISSYRMKSGELYIPATAIYGCMINSAGAYKIGKKSATYLIAGTARVEPFEIPLGIKKYEIDIRRVVIQRQGIMKARAMIPNWKAKFKIILDDTFGITPELLKTILSDAGIRVGLLDFRPAKKGWFGQFEVSKFEVLKD